MATKKASGGISPQKINGLLKPHKTKLHQLGVQWAKADDTLDAARMALGLEAIQAKNELTDANAEEEQAREAVLKAIGQERLDWQSVRKWGNAAEVGAVLPKKIRDELTLEATLAMAAIDAGERETFAKERIAKGETSRAAMRDAVRKAVGKKEPTTKEKTEKIEAKFGDDARVIRAKLAGVFDYSDKQYKAILSAALFAARVSRNGAEVEKPTADALATLLNYDPELDDEVSDS
jgi:hypothetical protein